MAKETETIFIFGGDGYLGWSLGLAFAKRTNFKIVLFDSLIKRKWEKEVNAKLLVPFSSPEKRIAEFKRIFGKANLSFESLNLLNYGEIAKKIKKHSPAIIINAAQQPSAPFSMISPRHAAITFSNNIIGHLNAAWAIAETGINTLYIKLGSAGCYSGIDTDYLPAEKTDLDFYYKGGGRKVLKTWLPMAATDFYHQSKISDFQISDIAANVWGMKIITVQQSTIFGATIEENQDEEKISLSARFNYDAVFSTVINRFVSQIAIGHPMTIYGSGSQTTGLISLADTVDNFMNLAFKDVRNGQHLVIHNFTHRLSINEIAKTLKGLVARSSIVHLSNPRKEMNGMLGKEAEVDPAVIPSHKNKNEKFRKELLNLADFAKLHKSNIDSSIILPKILWEKGRKSSAAKRYFLTAARSGR